MRKGGNAKVRQAVASLSTIRFLKHRFALEKSAK
jgi:hypothetical protein